jgi:hypothetical protein
MVYISRMKKNKKIPVLILLLSIYTLFMCQEIIVNQVLCVKDNGNANIELAIFGFQCECKKEVSHAHLDFSQIKTLRQLCAQCFDCVDLPQENTWIKRNINNTNFEINLVKQCDLDTQIYLQLDNPSRLLPGSILKGKFLYNSLPTVDSVIFRC